MERQFVLSLSVPPCREVAVPAASPRILLAGWHGRPLFREGQTVGTWRCIVAFDSVAAVAPSFPPPPVLSPLVYGLSYHMSSKLMAKSFDFLGFQTGFVFEVELMIDSEILDTFSFQESTAGVST